MTPAKEVGGDFYDFFMVDDDHLAFVVADVSGKGFNESAMTMYAQIGTNCPFMELLKIFPPERDCITRKNRITIP